MQDRTPSIRLAVRRAALLFVAGAAILVVTGCVTTTTNPPGPDPFALSEAEVTRLHSAIAHFNQYVAAHHVASLFARHVRWHAPTQ